MYWSTKRYIVFTIASLIILSLSIVLVSIYPIIEIDYSCLIHYLFTTLVSLVAIDTISLVFLATWVIGFVEGLDSYIKRCMDVEECGIVLRASRAKIIGLADYPIWYVILYVVSVTFITSAAYIVVVLVKYGYSQRMLLPYSEGVLASSLLYILGYVLGALASIIILFSLVKLGDYTGTYLMYYVGLVSSTKYLVDLATLIFNITLPMAILGLVLTILSIRYTVKMDREIASKTGVL